MGIDMHRQFHVGKYYTDLYIPALGLVLECDEGGHKNYDDVCEQKRQRFIEDTLKCTFLRFNPNAPGFDLSDVINDVLKVWKVGDNNEKERTKQAIERTKQEQERTKQLEMQIELQKLQIQMLERSQ